jgi:AraC family transcriptional regulator
MDAMTTGKIGRYSGRMARVAGAMAKALADGHHPTIEELASAAAFSPFHFQRIYRLLTGETVAASIQRLKIAHALDRVGSGETITSAAHGAGYSSSQNLAKAVRSRTGASVTDLRQSGKLARKSAELKSPAKGDNRMAFELVETSPIRIACRMTVGPYDQLNLGYRSLFEDFCGQADPEAITGVYGIPVDDSREVPTAEHRFIAALGVSDGVGALGKQIEVREIAGGRHAMLRHEGPYSELPAMLDALYREALEAGLEPAGRETFIHYVDQPNSDDGPAVVHQSDIYLPVE